MLSSSTHKIKYFGILTIVSLYFLICSIKDLLLIVVHIEHNQGLPTPPTFDSEIRNRFRPNLHASKKTLKLILLVKIIQPSFFFVCENVFTKFTSMKD